MELKEMEEKAHKIFQQATAIFVDELEVEVQLPDTALNEIDIERLSGISETCIRNFYNFQYRVDPNQHLVFIVIDADFFDLDF